MRTLASIVSMAAALLAVGPAPAAAPPRDKGPGPASRVVVSEILIEGSRNVPAEDVRNQLKTRIGQEYSVGLLQDDVRNLYATRQFANVFADLRQDGPGRVKVVFVIRDHNARLQKVQYRGNVRLSSDDLDRLTSVRRGMPCNPIANKAACQRIVQRYRDEGRPWASCALLKGDSPSDTEVVFNITEGPVVRVRSVTFTGNTFVCGDVLRNKLKLGVGHAAAAERAFEKLTHYYRSFGYKDVRVSRELRYSPEGRTVDVVFQIQEGPRYRVLPPLKTLGNRSSSSAGPSAPEAAAVRVRSMEFKGNRFAGADVLKERIAVCRAAGLSMAEFAVEELKSFYRAFGFEGARVTAEKTFSSDGRVVDLTFRIREGERSLLLCRPHLAWVKRASMKSLEDLFAQEAAELRRLTGTRRPWESGPNYAEAPGRLTPDEIRKEIMRPAPTMEETFEEMGGYMRPGFIR